MNLILFGAPGSGKGTQAPAITQLFDICHLSTGDILRDAVANKTDAGLRAQAAMDGGRLVSDDIVLAIVNDAMNSPKCAKGFLLDGFPRTLVQAVKLDEILSVHQKKIDKVIAFEVPDEVIVQRTSGRWIHKESGRSYHEIFHPPKVPKHDDVTGQPLIQRPDDKAEIVKKRLVLFHTDTVPVLNYYEKKGILSRIDGNRSMKDVQADIVSLLVKPWYRFW